MKNLAFLLVFLGCLLGKAVAQVSEGADFPGFVIGPQSVLGPQPAANWPSTLEELQKQKAIQFEVLIRNTGFDSYNPFVIDLNKQEFSSANPLRIASKGLCARGNRSVTAKVLPEDMGIEYLFQPPFFDCEGYVITVNVKNKSLTMWEFFSSSPSDRKRISVRSVQFLAQTK